MTAGIIAGQELGPVPLTTDQATVQRYMDAVGEASRLYNAERLVPPTALAAWAMRALLELVGLPPGTVHLSQETETRQAVASGATLSCRGRISQRSQRRDSLFWTIEFTLLDQRQQVVMEGKTSMMTPGTGGSQ